MYTICNFFTAFRNRGKSIIGEICTILVGYMIIVIDVVVFDQVTINIAALLIGYCNIAATDIDGFTDEVYRSPGARRSDLRKGEDHDRLPDASV